MEPLDLFARLIVACLLGAAIGYERDLHRRVAGLRTHMLVSLAAAAFMIVSVQFARYQVFATESKIEVDASRIASQVVAGSGFLVGGAILRSGLTVQGLTTAAGLWTVTAIGCAAGAGMFIAALSTTTLALLALWGLRSFGSKGHLRRPGEITVIAGNELPIRSLIALIEESEVAVLSHSYRVNYARDALTTARFTVRHSARLDTDAIVAKLRALPAVRAVEVKARD